MNSLLQLRKVKNKGSLEFFPTFKRFGSWLSKLIPPMELTDPLQAQRDLEERIMIQLKKQEELIREIYADISAVYDKHLKSIEGSSHGQKIE